MTTVTRLEATEAQSTSTTRHITTNPPSNPLPIYTGYVIRRHLRTAIFWAVAFALYTALILATFPSLRDSGALSMDAYPEAMIEAFNIQDMTEVSNYLESQVTSFAPLVIAFFAIMTFAGAIAGAEERGSLDITLGTPLPRRDIVLANWIAVAVLLLGILTVTALVTWLTAIAIDVDLGLQRSLEGFLNAFPITMAFGSLALALSARLRSRGAVIGISFAVLFLMYLVNIIGQIADGYDDLRWGSAFRYYGSAIMDGINWGHVAILMGASGALLAVAIWLFDRRDVYT
jgi:ABC-2 type transport system permease protein